MVGYGGEVPTQVAIYLAALVACEVYGVGVGVGGLTSGHEEESTYVYQQTRDSACMQYTYKQAVDTHQGDVMVL